MLLLVLGENLPGAVRRLGGRGPVQLPADRLLVQRGRPTPPPARRPSSPTASATSASCSACSCSGATCSARWRPARGCSASAPLGTTPPLAPSGWPPGRAAAVHRGDRQVGADPAARLAARRHGRPDAGQRADPRGDDGHRRRLHDGAAQLPVRAESEAMGGDRRRRHRHRPPRRDDRPDADDIKKVLAYSTVSQLGYMVAALGVGAFTAGIFHVVTHAFFKALLFLGAGSVIHAHRAANRTCAPWAAWPQDPDHPRHHAARDPGHRRRLRRWLASSPRMRSSTRRSSGLMAASPTSGWGRLRGGGPDRLLHDASDGG
jgi:hypothetical protein